MSSLSQIIESAKAKNATGLLIHPGLPPRIRQGNEWTPTELAPLSSVQAHQLFSSWLSEDERKTMQEKQVVEGIKTLGQIRFQYSFFMDLDGIKGALYWKTPQATNNTWWAFPELAVDTLNRPQGLVLVTGLRRSGKTSAVQSLVHAWAAKAQKSLLIVSDFNDWEISSSSVLVSKVAPSYFNNVDNPPAETDVIVIDSKEANLVEKALRWSEDGRLVVVTMTAAILHSGIERFLHQCEGSKLTNQARFALQFKMGLGLRLLPGLERTQVGAFELAMGTPEVCQGLGSGNLEALSLAMRSSEDKTIMRSMNHSLFQLVVKREVEFRTAFENSSDPTELDQLFRKVGI